ncbi:MAG: GntR family transcriptional regulator [Pseudonocardia sp.]|jgi:DNA-binding FadR family transcriptional regulator|nr:GntR family transcriptional regulator [Pseudonocardia sp.]
MAEEFGIDRATLREALRLLETQGVLRIKPGPGGGPVVRRPSSADLTGPLTLLLQSLGSTLEEALVASEALEPTAAALAARHATHAQLADLDRCLVRMEAALDGPAFYGENLAFHRLLGVMAANSVLLVVLEAIKQVTATIGRSIEVPRGVRADLVQTCRELRTALHTGDSAQATTVASAMLARWRALIVEQYPLARRCAGALVRRRSLIRLRHPVRHAPGPPPGRSGRSTGAACGTPRPPRSRARADPGRSGGSRCRGPPAGRA